MCFSKNEYTLFGIGKMSGVVILLIGTGKIAGIIANSTLKDVITEALKGSGIAR